MLAHGGRRASRVTRRQSLVNFAMMLVASGSARGARLLSRRLATATSAKNT